MGMVNKVVPFEQLEEETVQWAREMLQFSPTALRFMKASFNAATDGLAGLQQFAGVTLPFSLINCNDFFFVLITIITIHAPLGFVKTFF